MATEPGNGIGDGGTEPLSNRLQIVATEAETFDLAPVLFSVCSKARNYSSRCFALKIGRCKNKMGIQPFGRLDDNKALRRQVDAVNIRRRSLYSGLAARKGVSPQEVGVTAACSLLRRIAVGESYLSHQGGWQRYAPGRSPVPAYCG